MTKEDKINKKLNYMQKEVQSEYIEKIERVTAEKLLQTLYRQGLLKLELRDVKRYLEEYFR